MNKESSFISPVVRHTVRVDAYGMTEIGPVRSQNQDAIMVAGLVGINSGARLSWMGEVPEDGISVAVIDGMGGYAGGAEAAAIVATALAAAHPSGDEIAMNTWFEALSERVAQAGRAWGMPQMGATVALLHVASDGIVMANVGDCRIYRVTGGYLGQMSVDDRTDDPESSAVTQALGGTARIDAHVLLQRQAGEEETRERYLLCSDGVWGTLNLDALRDICVTQAVPGQAVETISASIYAQGATDNCSVIIVDITVTPSTEPEGAEAVEQGCGAQITEIQDDANHKGVKA
jgi:serine/threonine protein phosphatase PrpC